MTFAQENQPMIERRFMFSAPDPLAGNLQSRRGLTLLEVVGGLAISALMSGAIYAIVMGAVESTTSLAATQTEDRRVETFLRHTRNALAHLPIGASLELKLLENAPLRQEFTLRNVPDAFIWGNNSLWETPVITLSPRPWDAARKASAPAPETAKSGISRTERYSLGMSVPDFYRETADGEALPDSPVHSRQGNQYLEPDQEGRFWLDLLPEVDRVEWRFYDASKKLWLEQHPAARPPLVELRLFLPGRSTPLRAVFSIN